ncbi:flagellin [Dermatophilus congolensis]|uniref:flagellin N-terminal helical domain-containing protein n=1 Tax=Dermatophilus congolensis TaxID=1863 RepID=UPI001AAF2FC5|nr:flagellin [Dermatophilus congolensis]MBO3143420.1 flagellin FliC [Dermatophilus congolensis]MBO3152410.1 flagellin FliC [Dermatophilus congolensis]MBO3160579.1 flagellin FliC [Dermatophilus congolensis]MBO3163697.1 flagellin FliC [Dermatophilus congolensis]MBO3177244.1 flagellin FliC [Dermatophilus congolensis]
MGLQINTNVAAINSYRNLTSTQGAMQTSLERLSSGLRINRAADDAAGLAISEKLRSQVNGLNQAQSNAQDGVSLIQTAEGAMNESHSILQRMRTLAVQSASDTNTDSDRAQIQKEITALVSELDGIASRTQFNGMTLADGSFSGKTLQIGANAGQTMMVSITNISASALNVSSVNLSTQATAASALSTIDAAINTLSGTRADLGALQNRLDHTIKNLGVSAENLAASESRIRDTDMAKEMTSFTRSQILQQAGTAMLSQANQSSQGVLRLLG